MDTQQITAINSKSLDPGHRRELEEGSSILPEIIKARGYFSTRSKVQLGELGFAPVQRRVPALVIPLHSPNGAGVAYQIKPDDPRPKDNGKVNKYETAAGASIRIDVPPTQKAALKDKGRRLWVTEGSKKADALASRGECAISLSGVDCWQRNGYPLPDWEDVRVYGREVIVAYDSDVITKPGVQRASKRLAAYLEGRAANVKILYLPPSRDGGKQGVDDYLAAGGTIEDLLRYAEPASIVGIVGIDDDLERIPDATPFPIGALPEKARRLVEETAAALPCPPEFVGLPMLTVLGTAIANSRVVSPKPGWEEGTTLYAAVVAPPGAKKSPAMRIAAEPATKAQAAFKREYMGELEEYKRQVRDWEVDKKEMARLGEPAPSEPIEPVMRRTVVDNATVEALASVHEGNPRGVLGLHDELAGWLGGMNQYRSAGRGADRQFWLKVWSNETVTMDRKSRPDALIIPRPFIGVVGAIQPAVLRTISDAGEDGLMDRFVFAYPESVPDRWSDAEISERAKEGYRELYERLRRLHMPRDDNDDPEPSVLYLSPEAKELLKAAVNEHAAEVDVPGFPPQLEGAWAKLRGYVARIALILALCRTVSGPSMVPERVEHEDLLAALAIVDYLKNHARRVYSRVHGRDPVDALSRDVAAFVGENGGYWKGMPADLHQQLESPAKPARPDELTKRLKAVADRTPRLKVESKAEWVPELKNNRRFITLTLKNGVNAANAVKAGADA